MVHPTSPTEHRETQHQQFGVHLTIDGYYGSPEKMSDTAELRSFLDETVELLQMHKISEPVIAEVGPNNKKDPGGISAFVMIAESHISIHTFPRRGFISADIYTCNNELDTERVLAYCTEVFELDDVETNCIRRGTRYPVENLH
ncbi:adenosylmethionine decarboxylase [Patescibacteria group bacterium]|jgi:S-adenosylmethionine decarboxylase|nr:adenosylmethionine decarboxylase [Patescibacteria group bacterium]